jgi:hypothetical protein
MCLQNSRLSSAAGIGGYSRAVVADFNQFLNAAVGSSGLLFAGCDIIGKGNTGELISCQRAIAMFAAVWRIAGVGRFLDASLTFSVRQTNRDGHL